MVIMLTYQRRPLSSAFYGNYAAGANKDDEGENTAGCGRRDIRGGEGDRPRGEGYEIIFNPPDLSPIFFRLFWRLNV